LKTQTKKEILLGGLEFGLPSAPFRDAEEVFECEQFAHRGFFHHYGEDSEPGKPGGWVPGLPFALTPFGEPSRRRAPDVGEHTEEILTLLARDSASRAPAEMASASGGTL
jgi:crotonobetainyl-CoA:carnitine CoA-transferase CaiB-like acyl-CoA transferase